MLKKLILTVIFVIVSASFTLAGANAVPENAGKRGSKSTVAEQEKNTIKITIIYDNYLFDNSKDLKTDWGFACLVEGFSRTILFDTGHQPDTLVHNCKQLNIDLQKVGGIVISHNHHDHVGGLPAILPQLKNIPLYLPFSTGEKEIEGYRGKGAKIITSKEPVQLCKGVHLTGEMGTGIKEQALILDTHKGLVVITGCSHPGIIEMVRQAEKVLKKKVYFVLDGFHLLKKSKEEVAAISSQFKRLGVQMVGATHCTGDNSIQTVKDAYKENFVTLGVGKIITIQ
ncbi:MAG: MBL fold metallo-hydrolase [bacterium]|nr:MBL fold metallo-hydrolase [bacterium]